MIEDYHGRLPSGNAQWRRARLVPPERVHHLRGVPNRHEVPPPIGHRHREVLGRAAAPVGNLERLGRPPAMWTEVRRTEPHRRDLAPTGPAGQRRPCASSQVGGATQLTLGSAWRDQPNQPQ